MNLGVHSSAHNICQLRKLIKRYVLVLEMYQVPKGKWYLHKGKMKSPDYHDGETSQKVVW